MLLQIATNWQTAKLDARQVAILEFAMDVCHCRPLSDGHYDNLEKHGLNKDDAWDIGAVVALFALSNRMAFVTNMKPNEEFYLMGRVKKEKKPE
jgi:alkylhydroperoxidase family enzyme